jgi:hypothetical protein
VERVKILAPEGMSYVNAYHALYRSATSYEEDTARSISEEDVNTAEKVALMFRDFPAWIEPKYYIDCEGGRSIKVSFEYFPLLDVTGYDRIYGIGSALRVLQEYDNVSTRDRFDRCDRYRLSHQEVYEVCEKMFRMK